MKEKINIVWFKRDLRIEDHEPFVAAAKEKYPILLLYFFEPSLMSLPETDDRHWRFCYQSIVSLNKKLELYHHKIFMIHDEVILFLEKLLNYYDVATVYSHKEVGLKKTFDRDKEVEKYLQNKNILWHQFEQEGIVRGKKNRIGWEENWYNYMSRYTQNVELDSFKSINLSFSFFNEKGLNKNIRTIDDNFQIGGIDEAQKELNNFLGFKIENYLRYNTKPDESRKWGSRLSPYLSYGCLSLRAVYQAVMEEIEKTKDPYIYKQYIIRLFWRSHYIQKLETEYRLEFEPSNIGFKNFKRSTDEDLLTAFIEGKTGFPIIDAALRCLKKTGYVNFRLRATLVTFATFTLWLDWKMVAQYLASLFLDFEPGIHYGQIQIQAGLSGYHTLRIYSPIAQSEKHDPEGKFVKEWMPELKDVPSDLLSKPWEMCPVQQEMYHCILGKDYPRPIVDYEIATQIARNYYWKSRQKDSVIEQLPAIWEKHCLPKNLKKYKETLHINLESLKRKKKRN